jgi:hypothetical protein
MFSVICTLLKPLVNTGLILASLSLTDGSKMGKINTMQVTWRRFSHLAQGRLYLRTFICIMCIHKQDYIRSRNCIGKNFALQEMRISLASLLKHFDIAPIPQEMEDSKNRRHFITLTVEKNSFKIKVKRRS